MIQQGTHHVTKVVKNVAECDTPGCTQSTYLPSDISIGQAALHMRRLGWKVIEGDPAFLPAQSWCPDHVESQPVPEPSPVIDLTGFIVAADFRALGMHLSRVRNA